MNDLRVGDRVYCDVAMCPGTKVYATVINEAFKNSQGEDYIQLRFDKPQHGSRIRNVPVDVLDKCNESPRFHKWSKKQLIEYIEKLEKQNE